MVARDCVPRLGIDQEITRSWHTPEVVNQPLERGAGKIEARVRETRRRCGEPRRLQGGRQEDPVGQAVFPASSDTAIDASSSGRGCPRRKIFSAKVVE